MAEDFLPEEAGVALRARLKEIVPHILGLDFATDSLSTIQLLSFLAAAVRRSADKAHYWLLMSAVAGALPVRDELLRGLRLLELSQDGFEHYALLEACGGMASVNPNFARTLKVLISNVVVDVDFSARHGHNTGIQRVVRQTVARWEKAHNIELVVWTDEALNIRSLVPEERARVVDWNSSRIFEWSLPSSDDAADLVIPWGCTLILPEVAQHRVWDRLACLAEFSNNRVVVIGYDAIPVSSSEYVIPSESDRFIRYLSIVKHADMVLGISESSSEEFAGFAASLAAQNISGPVVRTVRLPVDLPAIEVESSGLPGGLSTVPLVVCVGTQEPRKNQLGVLAAAELLWQQGIWFDLLFIGSAAMPLSIPFDVEMERLQKLGRPVSVQRLLGDADLLQAYRAARFSIFISLHEGYGLPVGESLAAGTPVLTTNYGSTAEIARDGGCILVDPRDDAAISQAMYRLLVDDSLIARLKSEAFSRVPRTWDQYSIELWDAVAAVGAHR